MDVIEGGSPEREGMRGLRESARGIMLGDVIVAIDEEPVLNEDDLLNALENHRAGDTVTVSTLRENERRSYRIELQASNSPAR